MQDKRQDIEGGDNVSTSIIITAIICGTLIIFKIFDFVKK